MERFAKAHTGIAVGDLRYHGTGATVARSGRAVAHPYRLRCEGSVINGELHGTRRRTSELAAQVGVAPERLSPMAGD
jgi:hypothetical protein